MKKIPDKPDDVIKMFDQKSKGSSGRSTDQRIQQLETAVFFLFGLLFGMILTQILIHAF